MEKTLKSIRLPETELANLAFKARSHKRDFLERWIRPKQIEGSYEPLRKSLGEAASAALPMFPDLQPTSLDQLERLVRRECKGNGKLIDMNLQAVLAIRAFVEQVQAEAEYFVDLPMLLHPGFSYAFWMPLIVRYGGQARVVFLNLRRTTGLTIDGLHFCFSVMNERFRVLDPSYAEVGCEAWMLQNNAMRSIRVVREWAKPIPFELIIADVSETYAVLNDLRRSAMPKTGTGDGPLFGSG